MHYDLVGYLMDALPPEERARIELALRADPELRRQLQTLRRAFEPLALDREAHAPPPGLAARTMDLIAAQPRPEPVQPSPRRLVLSRRFVEMAVAAVCLMTVTGLMATWMARVRGMRPDQDPGAVNLVECRDNLRKLFHPLRNYADSHQGNFPNVSNAAAAPRNTASLVFPILHDAKLLPTDFKWGHAGAAVVGVKDVQAMDADTYQRWSQAMTQCYAYSLGFQRNGLITGLKVEEGMPTSLLPIMADCPPVNTPLGNSPAHGGRGQHVLYADGHVTFAQARHVGFAQDDIYLNRSGRVAAGHDWKDAVLSSGAGNP